MANFDKIVGVTFGHEGGFQNYPNDSANYCGGKLIGTNRGISAQGYAAFYGVCPTVEQIKALTESQARQIYKAKYWDKLSLDNVKNDSVAALMFQYIIGSGASQISDIKDVANKTAGSKLFVLNDNYMTVKDAEKINGLNQAKFWENLKAWRMAFYDRLVASNPTKYGPFLKGWQRRLNSYTYEGTIDKKKILIISVSAVLIGGTILYFFKNVTIKQKIIVAISLGVIIYTALKIYDNYKNNAYA